MKCLTFRGRNVSEGEKNTYNHEIFCRHAVAAVYLFQAMKFNKNSALFTFDFYFSVLKIGCSEGTT